MFCHDGRTHALPLVCPSGGSTRPPDGLLPDPTGRNHGSGGAAVPITCPSCNHRINLKSPKPGRYRPKCPKCDQPFLLQVPANPSEPCRVSVLTNDTFVMDEPAKKPVVLRPPVTADTPVPLAAGPMLNHSSARPAPAGSGSHLFGLARTNLDPRKVTTPLTPQNDDEDEEYKLPKAEVRGYAIEREIGRGGMGAVFLARQLSLDRHVALKVMSKRWATDPVFVARFTREAFAAAQLCHPNIVQIHDIGEVEGTRFFSMEYVAGRSLADVVRGQGKLDPETAVGYILQAARGLRHAHDRGMIHRDVKPDNLLLDDQGLVKVADLGLVKTPATTRGDDAAGGSSSNSGLHTQPKDITGARIALGTPAYMSPEQCRDAATVDHRADIYSLGCTLYVLVTGRTPFEGTTAVELMTKHAYEPLVPPELIVTRLPKEVSAIIQRMMEKNADDRFQSMGELVRTLEAWLGVHHSGSFSPAEEQIAKLETYVIEFNTAPTAVLRGRLVKGFTAGVLLVGVLLLFFGKFAWSFGLLGLLAQTSLAYFMLDGFARKGHLFTRVRQFLFGLTWWDWLVGTAGLAMFGVLLALMKVFWIGCGFGLIGVALAFALRYGLDRKVDEERRSALDATEKLLRRFRAQGQDEDELRQFVAKFAGRNWEEFFETLFGYEAKMTARAVLLRGGSAGPRERYAAWREPLIAAIDKIERVRKEARERKLLQEVECARLVAAGAAQDEADRQARATADVMVREADQMRRAEAEWARHGHGTVAAYPLPGYGAAPAQPADPFDFGFVPDRPDPVGSLVGLFVGPHIRVILAAVLLVACGIWAHQNGLLPGAEFRDQATRAMETKDFSGLKADTFDTARETQPLKIEGIPEPMTAWVDSFNVGAAGLLLLASLFFRGNLMSVFVLLGAFVTVAGTRFGIRSVEPIREAHVALMLGSVLTLMGFRVSTR